LVLQVYLAQRRKARQGGDGIKTIFTGGNGDNRNKLNKLCFLCSLLLEEIFFGFLRPFDFAAQDMLGAINSRISALSAASIVSPTKA
jgi:hypothetical protein